MVLQPKLVAVILLSLFGFVIIWVTIFFAIKIAGKVFPKVKRYSFKRVSCKGCRFFTNNPYLKCTVHPSTVLTKQSLNCPDYQSDEPRVIEFREEKK
ncbi:hypothetical protein Mic7113_5909 [Allocoleopsis franciscana PCC 7113]|uniref:Uncharacterized protein n=1 Tax=Allocoleopsis franciscana PCC 7113 TaxID=1173027 RepID=K9WMT5_9CYAN|nr:hypothetical protein Mic7113_5909 [Allocoleopsis franciscana PCC 7113]